MESIDSSLESIFQTMLAIEEMKDQILDILGVAGDDFGGATPTEDSSKLNGRIQRAANINARLQHVHVDLGTIHGELGKI